MVRNKGTTRAMCADLEAAEQNRRRVANGENIQGYRELELWLEEHPNELPETAILGVIPQAGDRNKTIWTEELTDVKVEGEEQHDNTSIFKRLAGS